MIEDACATPFATNIRGEKAERNMFVYCKESRAPV